MYKFTMCLSLLLAIALHLLRCSGQGMQEVRIPENCTDASCDYFASWTYDNETQLINFAIKANADPDAWTGIGFSRNAEMSQSDAVIGWVTGGDTDIMDSFLTGYAMPQRDAVEDLVNSEVTYQDGRIEVEFSRACNTGDTNDMQFSDECYYFFFPVDGGSAAPNNQLEMHFQIPTISPKKVCIGDCLYGIQEVRFPENCADALCDYFASWTYDDQTQLINFAIKADASPDTWTGIGFSRNAQMPQSDAVIGWDSGDSFYIMDSFLTGYAMPQRDAVEDLTNSSVTYQDGRIEVQFSRACNTGDANDMQFSHECYYFFFPVSGGPVTTSNRLGMHFSTPVISQKKICIVDCLLAESMQDE